MSLLSAVQALPRATVAAYLRAARLPLTLTGVREEAKSAPPAPNAGTLSSTAKRTSADAEKGTSPRARRTKAAAGRPAKPGRRPGKTTSPKTSAGKAAVNGTAGKTPTKKAATRAKTNKAAPANDHSVSKTAASKTVTKAPTRKSAAARKSTPTNRSAPTKKAAPSASRAQPTRRARAQSDGPPPMVSRATVTNIRQLLTSTESPLTVEQIRETTGLSSSAVRYALKEIPRKRVDKIGRKIGYSLGGRARR